MILLKAELSENISRGFMGKIIKLKLKDDR